MTRCVAVSYEQNETCLLEVMIQRQCFAQRTPLHQFEAHAINPVPLILCKSLATIPRGFQEPGADRDDLRPRRTSQRADGFQRRTFVQPLRQQGERLHENQLVRHKPHAKSAWTAFTAT